MKRYLLLIAIAGFLAIPTMAQWSFQLDGPDLKVESLNEDSTPKDVEFDFKVINPTNSVLELRWRIMSNDFPSSNWEDFSCDEICYTSATRAKDFDVPANTEYPIVHHISMKIDPGFGTSTMCFFERGDSAGSVSCLTARAATSIDEISDTLWVASNGTDFGIVKGKVYVLDNGSYVEYSNYSKLTAGGEEFIVIDGKLFWFQGSKYEEYTDLEEIVIGSTTYYVIEGEVFIFDGVTTYTLVAGASKVDVDGKEVYVINGDSFELFQGSWVPLAVNDLVTTNQNSLSQNSPNPFKVSTTVTYNLSGSGQGTLIVYDLTGKKVESHALNSNVGQVMIGQGLSEGVYFYSLWTQDGQLVDNKRMSVIK